MGIDFSHCEAHWGYGGFNRFRGRLMMTAFGVELDQMIGFGGGARSWEEFGADPISLLINHSDCDGELSVDECRKIAPRLREIVAPWSASTVFSRDREEGLKLADGMEMAASDNEPLRFM